MGNSVGHSALHGLDRPPIYRIPRSDRCRYPTYPTCE
ncbi:hypothetical protein C3L33_19417, partial [Rhododendron williamsianum]